MSGSSPVRRSYIPLPAIATADRTNKKPKKAQALENINNDKWSYITVMIYKDMRFSVVMLSPPLDFGPIRSIVMVPLGQSLNLLGSGVMP